MRVPTKQPEGDQDRRLSKMEDGLEARLIDAP